MRKETPDISALMKDLTRVDFLKFGVDQISYIRPAPLNARQAWSMFSADGQKISDHLTEGAAKAASRQRDLHPVRVH